MRDELSKSSFLLWANYGYFLPENLPIGADGMPLLPVEAAIAWVNYWEHKGNTQADFLQGIVAYDLLGDIEDAEYSDSLLRLNTYLTVPGTLELALETGDPIAQQLVRWGSEWTVLLSRTAPVQLNPEVVANLRDDRFITEHLLTPLQNIADSTIFYENAGFISDADYVADLRERKVRLINGEIRTFDPSATQTFGGTEFANATIRKFYEELDEDNGVITCADGSTRQLYSRRVGQGTSAVYLMDIGGEQMETLGDINEIIGTADMSEPEIEQAIRDKLGC